MSDIALFLIGAMLGGILTSLALITKALQDIAKALESEQAGREQS